MPRWTAYRLVLAAGTAALLMVSPSGTTAAELRWTVGGVEKYVKATKGLDIEVGRNEQGGCNSWYIVGVASIAFDTTLCRAHVSKAGKETPQMESLIRGTRVYDQDLGIHGSPGLEAVLDADGYPVAVGRRTDIPPEKGARGSTEVLRSSDWGDPGGGAREGAGQ